eukprot:CAMPEP_0170650018 /NCGR_PEP_ID=MMETSP0224-20130122/45592_1 /TAXON_ID=285029 /ORGANISM="Togula jolla, Strain CCCM 725" /LENGTH=741 /DNA_ID=CAMNT_0010981679 /DNA_START=21 /DNA_END=2242 /DNA_ORIENTATION=-
MTMLEKLREKHLKRQAAESSLEALWSGGNSDNASSVASVTAPAAPVSSRGGGRGGSSPSPAKSPPANGAQDRSKGSRSGASPFDAKPPGSQPAAKRTASTAPAASPSSPAANGATALEPKPFAADGPCPSSPEGLQACVARFICGSPAFGPLPISAVGLNAALRREYMRAGHSRAAVGVFRASGTAEALRGLHRALAEAKCADSLVLEDATDDGDLLVVDADIQRIYGALLRPPPGDSADWQKRGGSSSKRARRSRGEGSDGSAACSAIELHSGGACGGGAASPEASKDGWPSSGDGRPAARPGSLEAESVEDLLKAPTARQRQLMSAGDELRQLLAEPTARQSIIAQKFMNKSQNMAQFCANGSRADCRRATDSAAACAKIHFKKIIKPWTDESLGDCSYLDTCRHIDKCKYVHYSLDLTVEQAKYLNECGVQNRGTDTKRINELAMKGMELPSQWIQCDLKTFPLSIFKGQIAVVMADPPWDIHMELPYGTLTDDEVRNLKIGDIHEDGMIFLWVTGRAMELARDCFRIWGYKRIEEIIWVKTNQLQRIIRTGRTGHWINHSKEHCLVGIKGNPRLNRNLDCDVIVSEVRETSRKPDEIYNLIERMFPNCMKLELFGRPHNVHENWITLGNQLDGVRLCDEDIVKRYNQEFPERKVDPWKKELEAMVPIHSSSGSSRPAGRLGNGTTSEDAPWIPPMSGPPSSNASGSGRPSSAEAWTPPNGVPPHGYGGCPPTWMPQG